MTSPARPVAQHFAHADALAVRLAAVAADHASATNRPALPVVVLPANPRPLVKLPATSAQAFARHLDGLVAAVFAEPVRDNAQPMSAQAHEARVSAGDVPGTPPPGTLSPDMVAASCATCAGECCTAGGTHAFLRHDSVVRVRARLAEAGADDRAAMANLYMTHLPLQHYRGSCVFHGARGCALPRDLRADLCNRYQCTELTQLQRSLEADARGAYVGASDGRRLRRVSRLAALPNGTMQHDGVDVSLPRGARC